MGNSSSGSAGIGEVRIAFYQFAPTYLKPNRNLDRIELAARECGADLLVLPELCTSGYLFETRKDLERIAELIPDGPTTTRLKRIAKEFGVALVAGIAERTEDGRLFNSAVIVDPTGFVGQYRKTHLFDSEKSTFEEGDTGFRVFALRLKGAVVLKVGVMICFDWQFPEAARALAVRGAQVIAHPSNLVLRNCPKTMPIRSQENAVFTVTANRIGSETVGSQTLTFTGSSLICDPTGSVLTVAPETQESLGVVSVDPERAFNKSVTPNNDLFEDRRPEFYVA